MYCTACVYAGREREASVSSTAAPCETAVSDTMGCAEKLYGLFFRKYINYLEVIIAVPVKSHRHIAHRDLYVDIGQKHNTVLRYSYCYAYCVSEVTVCDPLIYKGFTQYLRIGGEISFFEQNADTVFSPDAAAAPAQLSNPF